MENETQEKETKEELEKEIIASVKELREEWDKLLFKLDRLEKSEQEETPKEPEEKVEEEKSLSRRL